MKYAIYTFLLILSLTNFGCKSNIQSSTKAKSIALFSEISEKWSTTGNAEWHIESGILSGKGGEGYVTTTSEYNNFILTAEFFPDKVVNSGIFIRCPKDEVSATGCYEINIWDNHINQDFRTGAIVTHGKPLAHLETIGKWNNYKIRAENNHMQVWLNGVKTADLVSEITSNGFITLQVKGGVIKFRNVRIERL